jgi:hypothetical protein
MDKLLGGNPLAVVLRLVIICIVTGIVLRAVGVNPADLLHSLPDLIRAISEYGWSWVETAFQYFFLGAIIVIPIWLVVRLVKLVAGDEGNSGRPSRS